MTAPAIASERRTIPFDYAFRFQLTGELDKPHKSVLRLSVEASFMAVAIGYGFIPRRDPVRFGPSTPEDFDLDDGQIPALRELNPTLKNFRVSWISNSLRRILREQAPTSQFEPRFVRQRAADLSEVLERGIRFNRTTLARILARGESAPLDPADMAQLFEELPPNDEPIQFLYRLADEGTGREFASDYILSTAGLGIHDGDRPFRQFAVPIVFDRLSTIRMDVIEKSTVPCELHVSLQGYRVLGESGTPTDPRRAR